MPKNAKNCQKCHIAKKIAKITKKCQKIAKNAKNCVPEAKTGRINSRLFVIYSLVFLNFLAKCRRVAYCLITRDLA